MQKISAEMRVSLFDNSTGTWNTDAFWSTDAEGTSATSNPSNTTSDTVNFETAALITTRRNIT